MVRSTQWKYWITGALTKDRINPVAEPYAVIVESGIRDPASPFDLVGVGAIGHSNDIGEFKTSFSTRGADHPPLVPSAVSVFVREARGKWRPYVVLVGARHAHEVTQRELVIDLGLVEIEASQALFADEV